MLSDSAKTWLKSRGISEATAAALRIETVRRGRDGGEWLAFPYRLEGEVVTRKYRRIDEKDFSQDANPPKKTCFNQDALTEPEFSGPAILTEGEMDCAAGIEAGLDRIASVPDGAPNQPVTGDAAESSKWSYLDGLIEALAGERAIILAFDGDQNGANLLDHVAARLGKARCKFVTYPPGCKDLNDVLVKHGKEGVRRVIDAARYIPVKGLVKLRDLPPSPEMVVYRAGLSEDFDNAIGFVKGHLSVWTGIPNHGKALDVDTPIPTPSGFRSMGDLEVGDEVFGPDGKPVKIIATSDVMHGRPCYEIVMRCGERIVADAQHQWLTVSEPARRSARMAAKRKGPLKPRGTDQSHKRTLPSVVTSEEIASTLRSQGKTNHMIPFSKAVETPDVDLPVHPYVLGVWLGDGAARASRITCFDPELLDQIRGLGVEVTATSANGCYTLRSGIQSALRSMGLLQNKHVPDAYLWASEAQRRDLLRGLLDADGTASGSASRDVEFCNTNRRLAEAVYQLVASLGYVPRWCEGRAKLYGRDCGPKYRVLFRSSEPMFSITRKVAGQKVEAPSKINGRYIVDVRRVESRPVKCIQVDRGDGLFLCGRSFLITHNSALLRACTFELSRRHLWRFGAGMFEDDIRQDFRTATAAYIGKGKVSELTDAHWQTADRFLNERFTFILEDESSFEPMTVDWLLERMEAVVVREGAEMIVIDPWSKLDHSRPPGVSENDYTGHVLNLLKRFARRFNVHVAIVVHPKKIEPNKDGAYRPPGGYDISGCYTDDTEVMTEQGFKRHSELTKDDMIACFNPETSGLEYHKPSRIIRKAFEGDVHRYRGYGYDLAVTPEHRMVVKAGWSLPAGGPTRRWERDTWHFCEARDLPASRWKLPLSPEPLRITEIETVGIKLAAIAGWYVSEGCGSAAGIGISQAEGERADEIRDLLCSAGVEYGEHRSGPGGKGGTKPTVSLYIGRRKNRELVDWLKRSCGVGAQNKRVPDQIMRGTVSERTAFLNAYLAGDGYLKRNSWIATTTSKELADDLQRLAISLGLATSMSDRPGRGERHSHQYVVIIGHPGRRETAMQASRNETRERYSGWVWCLTVPTGAYFVRRNGRVAACGNSAHWYNMPDLGVTVYRDREEGEGCCRVIPWKIKRQPLMGRQKPCSLLFNPDTGRYSDWYAQAAEVA